jgi:EAL domain-containing protein (putative c-di-GMP-specific phosphodiesterase class I)
MAQTTERETFLIYIPMVYDEIVSRGIAEKFRDVATRRFNVKNEIVVQKTVSISKITYPQDKEDLDSLLKSLVSFLYQARRLNGNLIMDYDPDLKIESLDKYNLFKQAIKNKDIKVFFTPFFSLENREIYGTEFLINWHKDSNKIMNLRDLMNFAEKSKDDYWLGLYLFEQLLSVNQKVFEITGDKEYFVLMQTGVSFFNYDDINLVLQRLSSKYKIKPKNIILQVSNPLVEIIPSKIVKNILKLKSLGFKIGMEVNDYHSNLKEIINNYYVDIIKIKEQVLVADVSFSEFINFIKANNKIVIVTHVNNEDQIMQLLDIKVNFVQGSYEGFPCYKDELLPLMTKNRQLL